MDDDDVGGSVSRLMRHVKSGISERTMKRLKRLEDIINPVENHSAYREYLKVSSPLLFFIL